MKEVKYTRGSGNIYKDMGFLDAEERAAKAQLAMVIESIIERKGLKQAKAAEMLRINQPKVSALMNGKLDEFSMGRLIRFLNRLNQNVEIVVKPRSARRSPRGYLSVAVTR